MRQANSEITRQVDSQTGRHETSRQSDNQTDWEVRSETMKQSDEPDSDQTDETRQCGDQTNETRQCSE